MKFKHLGAALILAAAFTQPAHAAATYTWVFTVLEDVTERPMEGATINFELVDGKNGAKSAHTCTSDPAGKCSLSGTVSGGGFLSSAVANATFGVSKEGYEPAFKSADRYVSATTKAVTVIITPLAKPVTFTAVDDSGKPLEGVDVVYNDYIKHTDVKSACTTDTTGSCNYTPPSKTFAEYVGRKTGYFSAVMTGQLTSKQATLHLRLPKSELSSLTAATSLTCKSKAICDRLYSTAQIYMSKSVDMKVQFSNDTITETHNPVGAEQVAGRVTRTPAGKQGWEVSMELYCSKPKDPVVGVAVQAAAEALERACINKQLEGYRGFNSWVQARSQ